MVDHESWDNIVQAAPVMVVVLNKSEMFTNKSQPDTNVDHQRYLGVLSLNVNKQLHT